MSESSALAVQLGQKIALKRVSDLEVSTSGERALSHVGKISKILPEISSGLIECAGYSEPVYYSKKTELVGAALSNLKVGQIVQCEVRDSLRGPLAVRITVKETRTRVSNGIDAAEAAT